MTEVNVMSHVLKFQVGYSRKVQTQDYENLSVSLMMEFAAGSDQDMAFQHVRHKVEQWLHESLNAVPRTPVTYAT